MKNVANTIAFMVRGKMANTCLAPWQHAAFPEREEQRGRRLHCSRAGRPKAAPSATRTRSLQTPRTDRAPTLALVAGISESWAGLLCNLVPLLEAHLATREADLVQRP